MSGGDQDAVASAVERLDTAARELAACEPVRDLIGAEDIAVAYAVQQRVTALRLADGARIVGRKIGLTSPAVQRQIGVDRPDFGVLFDDMQFADGAEIGWDRLIQPKAEAEVAFQLGADILDASDPDRVRTSVDRAYPALEIVDSRVREWNIGITDTVADNASSGLYVLGTDSLTLDEFDPVDVRMQMRRGDEIVSTGDGRACLGDPLNALTWLACTAIEFGSPLRAGDIVLSGALGPMIDARPGDIFVADIAPLGTVTIRFAERSAATMQKEGSQ